ncbi:MAG: Gfo/Idh/MocA family oxidoreductase [Chloroflexi bacterium]|nr:Gfo/Idh/MocA family oxidoreductase [Chloroflexota bacterium]
MAERATSLADLSQLDLTPQWTGKSDYRLAIIGVGVAANDFELPAYRKAGFNLVAAASPSEGSREKARRVWGIERTYADYREMLERERPEIVSITIHDRWVEEKVRAVQAAAAYGVHALVQKPFGPTLGHCLAMVEAAERGGIKLAVNQNARWAPVNFMVRQVVRSGALGEPLVVNVEWRNAQRNRPILYTYCAHTFDLLRWWLPQPVRSIFASINYAQTGQRFVSANLQFAYGPLACVWDDWSSFRHEHWHLRVEGSEGMLTANECFGLNMEAPWLEVMRVDAPGQVFRPAVVGSYQPDGFIGAVRELMRAVECQEEPAHSGRDNLNTMRLIFAAHRSVAEGRAVDPATIGATDGVIDFPEG